MNENPPSREMGHRDYAEEACQRLLELQQNWDDQVPADILSSNSPGKTNYKARNAWFASVSMATEMLCMLEDKRLIRLPPPLRRKIKQHVKTVTDIDFCRRLKTAEDIGITNSLIEEIIATLRGGFEAEYTRILTGGGVEDDVPFRHAGDEAKAA